MSYINGISRIGLWDRFSQLISRPPEMQAEPTAGKGTHRTHTLGLKNYELTNHLGNVLTTISDRKLTTAPGHFTADITSAQDYYPFGSLMPGRKYSSNSYRYGFQGQEKDDEITGITGSHLAFKYRVHDTRLGRFLSVDPLASNYSWNSPYAFSENRVVDGIELEGREWSKHTTYDVSSQTFNVTYKVKVQVINASYCEMTAEKQAEMMSGIQSQFSSTYTQFDKDKNINYSAELEYEFIDDASQIGKDGTITILLRETTSNEQGGFVGGKTPIKGGEGGTQTNVITINTHVDGIMRDVSDIARTTVHELGHSGGLSHPWEIPDGSPEQDVKQGVAPDNVVKENIMNSGANPNPDNRYYSGSGLNATRSTSGQLKQVWESINKDNQ